MVLGTSNGHDRKVILSQPFIQDIKKGDTIQWVLSDWYMVLSDKAKTMQCVSVNIKDIDVETGFFTLQEVDKTYDISVRQSTLN